MIINILLPKMAIGILLYIIILINISLATSTIEEPLWCYCTPSLCGLAYCKAKKGGSCYNMTIESSSHYYGCMDKNQTDLECDALVNSRFVTKHCCRNRNYCNANENTLRTAQNMSLVIDPERENQLEKLSCYCTNCGIHNLCRTSGFCYKNLSTINITYGCVSLRRATSICESTLKSHVPTRINNINISCCHGEKWCNFDPASIDMPDGFLVYGDLELLWVRFEKSLFTNDYTMKAQNNIGGRVLVKVTDQLNFTEEYHAVDGIFPFRPTTNYLYKFELVPMVGSYELKPVRIFYFALSLNDTSTTFPLSLHLEASIPYIVICKLCQELTHMVECDVCYAFFQSKTNPIWVPELF